MQYSFLGVSVSKMMDFNLDMKDIAILRYFVDFKDSGKMNTEIVDGVTYYWVNYRSMEESMPYLALGKRAIMTRMLKLRDLGILNHYTKKEGGTFSFFALGFKYIELITVNKDLNKDLNKEDKKSNKIGYKNKLGRNILSMINENDNVDTVSEQNEETIKPVICNEQGVSKDSYSMFNYDYGVFQNEERVFSETVKGCVSKGRTKTPLLNNSSTKETNIKKYIKKEIEEIIEYLNQKIVSSTTKQKRGSLHAPLRPPGVKELL